MEAFRVLPSLGGPGPPPAPPSPRVAPRVRQNKDSSAFVILAELGDAQQVSGRSSPFRGKGFKGTPSRIPVMSAPSSPGPKKPTLTQGKSAPASPSRPVPAKRVSVKPPQSPKKTAARPTPRPRFPQKTGDKSGSKEELKPNTLKKTTEKQNLVTKQPTNEEPIEGTKVKETTTYDRFGKPVINKATLKRRVKAPTSKINDPERLNGRPRPTDKLPSNNRTMTRTRNTTNKDKKEVSDIMKKNEEANSVKSGLTSENKISSTLIDLGDVLNSNNENTEHKNDTREQKEESNPSATTNESSNLSNGFKNPLPPLEKHDADPQKEENPKIITNNNNFTSANTATQNNKNDSNTSSEMSQNASNNNLKVKTISSMYSGTTAAMFVTKKLNSENTTERRSGTTKVDVESIKEEEKEKAGLSNKQETVVTIERVDVTPNKDTSLILDEITDIDETVVHSNNIRNNKHTPNGDISPANHKNEPENGTNLKETLQNKIIIHQSDKNGPVKVIGSEPVTVSVDIDDVIKESIKTETVVAPNEVIEMATETARKEAQREMTSVEAEKEESGTVIGSPDIEVEAGRNSVSFRSPEIHPVSARRKPTLREKLCGCYGGKSKVPNRVPLKERRKCCSCWQLSWFKRDRGPHPPAKENEKQGCCQRFFCCCRKPKTDPPKPATQKQGLCRRMFCCCCKPKGQQSQLRQPAQPLPPANQRNQRNPLPKREMTKPNFWKRMFCCKCQNRTNDMGSRKSFGSKRDMLPKSRASSIASFPKLEATLVEHNSMMKAAIPVMPICLAWTCLILNVFVPGTGTILSGFLCVCFGKPRFSVKDSTFARLGSFFINLVIGIGQMFTIIFCFVGWGWSIWWGVIMLRLARKYRRIKIAEKNANEPPVVNQNHDVEHAS